MAIRMEQSCETTTASADTAHYPIQYSVRNAEEEETLISRGLRTLDPKPSPIRISAVFLSSAALACALINLDQL